MNRNVIIIGLLVVALLGAGGFAIFQTQNLTTLQTEATTVASDLRSSGTQAVDNAIATSTAFADSAYDDGTQAADNAIATSTDFAAEVYDSGTQAADNAIATSTDFAGEVYEIGTQAADNAEATATESADRANSTATELVDNSRATSTSAASTARAMATEVAADAATQAALGTDTASNLATEQFELTVAAQVYSDVEATLVAQNVAILGTVAANGYVGDGLFSDPPPLPDGFAEFEGTGYTLALPESFVGGDFAAEDPDLDDLEDAFDDADLNDSFDVLEDTEGILFFAVDTELLGDSPRSTVSLVREEPLTAETSVTDYINSAYFGLVGNFALLTADVLPLNGMATGRVLIDQTLTDNSVRQLQYVFLEEDTFYVLSFTTPVSEYANVRESLESIAASLRLTD